MATPWQRVQRDLRKLPESIEEWKKDEEEQDLADACQRARERDFEEEEAAERERMIDIYGSQMDDEYCGNFCGSPSTESREVSIRLKIRDGREQRLAEIAPFLDGLLKRVDPWPI